MTNRITAATRSVPIKEIEALKETLRQSEFTVVEAAPAFEEAYITPPHPSSSRTTSRGPAAPCAARDRGDVMTNRITAATRSVPIKEIEALKETLRQSEFTVVEAAPAFEEAYTASPARAVALARGLASTLGSAEEHRQLFQSVAAMDEERQRALNEGYRQEGQGRGVVQAIGLLPRAQGQALMRSMIVRPDGRPDRSAAGDVGDWLRDAGSVMRAHAAGLPSPDFDDAVVDFFEDVGDALSDAVNAVVDALEDVGEAFATAIEMLSTRQSKR